MKKALGILSVLVLITVMMISCNAEQKLDDTVGVSFNVSSSRELSVANESFVAVDSPDLIWYYHGEKKTDTQFITGQSASKDKDNAGYWTEISTGNLLSGTYVTFSQGQWSFEIKAVSTEKDKQVYYGKTNGNVLLTKSNRTISISVSPFVEGVNGTLVLSNVYIAPQNSNEKVGPNKLYINGTPIESTNYTIVNYEGGKAISYTNEVAPGTYTVEVKRVGEDTGVVLASASKTVVVYSGLTTTISGSVEEDTTSGRFDVNEDFVINTKEDLILFSELVNEVGMNFSGKTVKLAANIDLAGVEWKPIGQTGKTTFQGVFDGQGYTISNMTVNNTDTSKYCSSGFFGWIVDHGVGIIIKDTKFDNAHVEGNHNVGVVVGYIYGTIDGCEVSNSTIIAHNANEDANGDKVGGIAGYVGEDAFIDNNNVINCEITGNRDIGGIAGAVATGVDSFKNNHVTNATLKYVTQGMTEKGPYDSAGAIVSGRTGFVPDKTNTATEVTSNEVPSASTNDELTYAINQNSEVTVKLANAGTYKLPEMSGKEVSIIGTKDTVIDMENKVNKAESISFEGVTVKFGTNNYCGFQHTGKLTYRDCKIIGQQFLYANNVEFINCVFAQDIVDYYNVWTYGAGNVLFKDCTFNCAGRSVLIYNEGSNGQTVKFENCKFNATEQVEGKAAIEIDSSLLKNDDIYTVIIDQATADSVSGFSTGSESKNSVWNNKKGNKATVIVAGNTVLSAN